MRAVRVTSVMAALALALCAAGAMGAAAAAQTDGKAAFTHRCAMCHREGGTGTYVLARRLGANLSLLEKRSDLKPEYIRYVVRWGVVNMPRLSRVEVPDSDLDAIAAYLTQPAP